MVPSQVLDEIQAGVFDGMTYAQIEQTMPEEFAARKADKLGYRCVLRSFVLKTLLNDTLMGFDVEGRCCKHDTQPAAMKP